MQSDLQIISDILDREGEAFTDHPADRGGPTKWGVTLATYRSVVLPQYPNMTNGELLERLKALTRAEASDVLEYLYLIGPRFHLIANVHLRALVVDTGVQHGVERATKMLQLALPPVASMPVPDGIFGPKSQAAVNATPARVLYAGVLAARCQLYGSIITNDPVLKAAKRAGYRLQAENAFGWANRLATFIQDSDLL